MKFLIPFVLLMGMITGCAFQYQVDDHESRLIALETQADDYESRLISLESEIDYHSDTVHHLHTRITELEAEIEELQNLKEIKDRKAILELQEQSESYQKAFLFLAEEMDKHVVAIEALFKNDEATKTILESALKLFERMDERDKLIIEELDKK